MKTLRLRPGRFGFGGQMNRKSLWLGLSVLLLAAFACFAYPMYVIRPFRAQGATELRWALVMRAWGPWIALGCALSSFGVLFRGWQGMGRWSRVGSVLLVAGTAGFAGLCQVNVFEQMFHPIGTPSFAGVTEAKVDADDMVLAVSVGAGHRAYPIRSIAYHHIVNDWVEGTPITATY